MPDVAEKQEELELQEVKMIVNSSNIVFFILWATVMYKNSCGFVCEDFPKENQTLQTRNDL